MTPQRPTDHMRHTSRSLDASRQRLWRVRPIRVSRITTGLSNYLLATGRINRACCTVRVVHGAALSAGTSCLVRHRIDPAAFNETIVKGERPSLVFLYHTWCTCMRTRTQNTRDTLRALLPRCARQPACRDSYGATLGVGSACCTLQRTRPSSGSRTWRASIAAGRLRTISTCTT
jgi:hypothetical protein